MAESELVYRCWYEEGTGKIFDVYIQDYNVGIPEPNIVISKEDYDFIIKKGSVVNAYKIVENGILRDKLIEEKTAPYIEFWNSNSIETDLKEYFKYEFFKNRILSDVIYEILQTIDTTDMGHVNNFINLHGIVSSHTQQILDVMRNYDFETKSFEDYKRTTEDWKLKIEEAYRH